jgi:serine protease Do
VVVSEEGYILTCAHVNQRPGRTFTATFPDGRRVRAVTLGNNHGIDAGLAKITEDGKYPFANMGNSADVAPGQWCLAVGYPVSFVPGKQPAIRIGRVQVNKPRMIVTDCTIMGGDSGGPLFDLDGNVIGISSRVNNSIDTNIHVPVDTFRENWERMVAEYDWSDEDRRSYLGITRDEAAEGVVIKVVKPQSPAERAGVQVGDRIVEFDGRPVARFDDLLSRMDQRKPQDKVKLTVERGSKKLILIAQLDYWPTNQN